MRDCRTAAVIAAGRFGQGQKTQPIRICEDRAGKHVNAHPERRGPRRKWALADKRFSEKRASGRKQLLGGSASQIKEPFGEKSLRREEPLREKSLLET